MTTTTRTPRRSNSCGADYTVLTFEGRNGTATDGAYRDYTFNAEPGSIGPGDIINGVRKFSKATRIIKVKVVQPCICCGVAFPQEISGSRRPCKRPECIEEQSRRKALYYASEAARRQTEYEASKTQPSEDRQRYGRKVVAVESIDTAEGLAHVPVTAKTSPVDTETKKAPKEKEAPITIAKPKRSVTLEQSTVAAVISTDPEAPYGLDESGRPIQRPKTDAERHADLVSRVGGTSRCEKHEDYPAGDCFVCREEAANDRARERSRTELRPHETFIAPPASSLPVAVSADPKEAMLANTLKFFGLSREKEIPTPRRILPLAKTQTPWYATHPDDRQKYIDERIAAANRQAGGSHVTVASKNSDRKNGLSLREILGLSRKQIIKWVCIPEVLYGTIIEKWTVCDTTWIPRDSGVDKFELKKAEDITAAESQIGELKKEIADVEARRSVSGLDGRKIAAIKRRLEKGIKEAGAEITRIKRRKPPKAASKLDLVKVDVPGTEREMFSCTKPMFKADKVLSYIDETMAADDSRIFENAVIRRAHGVIFEPMTSISQKYPEIMEGIFEDEPQTGLDCPENTLILKTKGSSAGLSIRGQGRTFDQKTGRFKPRTLDSFDAVFDNPNIGKGRNTDRADSIHTDAPDYDPSDDPTE